MGSTLSLTSLVWLGGVEGVAILGDSAVQMDAPPKTDWFVDPSTGSSQASAPALVWAPVGDFQLTAQVTVGFGATFDAGVLFVHQGPNDYAKFCFEYAPGAQPMVVSVVTRGVSDDCNGPTVDGRSIWMRVSRIGPIFAFHHSIDANTWNMTRLFSLRDPQAPTQIGFLAQSPRGLGCTVGFNNIAFAPESLANTRNGS